MNVDVINQQNIQEIIDKLPIEYDEKQFLNDQDYVDFHLMKYQYNNISKDKEINSLKFRFKDKQYMFGILSQKEIKRIAKSMKSKKYDSFLIYIRQFQIQILFDTYYQKKISKYQNININKDNNEDIDHIPGDICFYLFLAFKYDKKLIYSVISKQTENNDQSYKKFIDLQNNVSTPFIPFYLLKNGYSITNQIDKANICILSYVDEKTMYDKYQTCSIYDRIFQKDVILKILKNNPDLEDDYVVKQAKKDIILEQNHIQEIMNLNKIFIKDAIYYFKFSVGLQGTSQYVFPYIHGHSKIQEIISKTKEIFQSDKSNGIYANKTIVIQKQHDNMLMCKIGKGIHKCDFRQQICITRKGIFIQEPNVRYCPKEYKYRYKDIRQSLLSNEWSIDQGNPLFNRIQLHSCKDDFFCDMKGNMLPLSIDVIHEKIANQLKQQALQIFSILQQQRKYIICKKQIAFYAIDAVILNDGYFTPILLEVNSCPGQRIGSEKRILHQNIKEITEIMENLDKGKDVQQQDTVQLYNTGSLRNILYEIKDGFQCWHIRLNALLNKEQIDIINKRFLKKNENIIMNMNTENHELFQINDINDEHYQEFNEILEQYTCSKEKFDQKYIYHYILHEGRVSAIIRLRKWSYEDNEKQKKQKIYYKIRPIISVQKGQGQILLRLIQNEYKKLLSFIAFDNINSLMMHYKCGFQMENQDEMKFHYKMTYE